MITKFYLFNNYKILIKGTAMKKFCILMGSPRLNKNTAELLKQFMQELNDNNCKIEYITLADKNILACTGCFACQDIDRHYGCTLNDDVKWIIQTIIESDCVVFTTPIYT